ncbi:Glu/Leu/Phe/Val dehydrogenase dimerization domain-containing protein [Raineya orbicola]|uniref:Glutamate/Leucine/Phenylalanine/Valine dehydrogenase n=1 Tax=Raineya orbicola TaxID=2016530 RepID=A0A2N3IJ69_9BACT|nr:Glu/Leu/Phe/Val dehydrogenase dimerization domain-containing protein [Raineya orbicola]PKQ70364.1 Glutamate/Leucine/Phenylalanine/Valine dehydrogenase [Raineya orbicola]
MKELLTKFENKPAEIVFEWHDSETEAKGWIVINSLRGGAAGGGTRMRKGLDRREVESLAKTMEIKFTVSGPPIGGAKSGIDFDPQDPRKHEVLKRWYKVAFALLKNYYGTGGDLNVDEIHEVIPITEEYGLWHPQEGIVNGHYNPSKPEKIRKIGQLRQGVSKIIEDARYIPDGAKRKYTVADMITGYGVAEAIRHFYTLWGGELKGKRAIIQGWGNVGATAALYLAKEGAKIVGIIDRVGGLLNPNGFTLDEIKKLFADRSSNFLVAEKLLPFEEVNQQIWSVGAEVFVPAAASRLVTQQQAELLIQNGLEVVSCGANVPFADPEIFYGKIAQFVDSKVALIPDFVANCGMARTFAYLMSEKGSNITDQAIFSDISETIFNALQKVHQSNTAKTLLSEKAFEIALKQLV